MTNEIKLKITIDNKEAVASLKLTDDNIKELYKSFKFGVLCSMLAKPQQIPPCFEQANISFEVRHIHSFLILENPNQTNDLSVLLSVS